MAAARRARSLPSGNKTLAAGLGETERDESTGALAAAASRVARERSVFVRSVSRENGRVIKSIGAPASGEGSGLGFRARWREDGATDVRIIDIHGG